MMNKSNLALGFYHESSTAKAVLAKLKKENFSRFASIHHKQDHSLEIDRYFPLSGLLSGFLNPEIIEQFKDRVVADEILILVEVKQSEIHKVLEILQQVPSGHPATFVLRPPAFKATELKIPSGPLSTEVLSQQAAELSHFLQQTPIGRSNNSAFMKRFNRTSKSLQLLRQDISDSEYIAQTIPSSAEWLLDNMYVIEGSIENVKLNLPKKYYKELPKILEGGLKDLPRIYVLAVELIKGTVGKLNRTNIVQFLQSFQVNSPLTIGELWAFPLMLQLGLIEWIEYLSIHVDKRMREGELASFWGNRLLNAARHDPTFLPVFIADLSTLPSCISGHFAQELLDHLFDEDAILLKVKNWFSERFNAPIEEVLHQDHLKETSEQVIFSDCIGSLITLIQLSWPEIFELVCPIDAILKEDPIGAYSNMDFATRNRYREVIEKIARKTHFEEWEVAKKALTLAKKSSQEYERHIGYYLIDQGLPKLEHHVESFPTFTQSLQRWITKHSKFVYLGSIFFIILLIESLLSSMLLKTNISYFKTVFFLILSLLPISELAVQSINYLLTLILPSPLRPKMLFESGIPEENKTLIVVPMLLKSRASIQEEINRLEIHYLANTNSCLLFGLLSDFVDASEQETDQDSELLSIAMEGVQSLERKYGQGKFYLFHRKRVWSNSENAYIGWERKRGKLEELNRFLMGEPLSEKFLYAGNAETLKGINFVITLDSDTQLPKDQARALIEVLAHPLNRPYINESRDSLIRGYTIIQPRVGTDFIHSQSSWFSKIFSEPTVVDPYTQAISNVYQDLTGESSYHGKGIYDLKTFHALLDKRFPEEHLLSHDLIEGAFVRVGFASSVCLFDIHPKDYFAWINRQHRWIRGDWQIMDWLMPKIPFNRKENTLSWLNRWKIFDNLRRSLLPISLLLLLTLGWVFSPLPGVVASLALLVLLLPSITLCLNKLFTYSFSSTSGFLKELKILILRSVVSIALLPFEAYNSLDAIIRVIYRRVISHRDLLQWTTGENSCGEEKTYRKFLFQIGWVSFFSVLILGFVFSFDPQAEWIAFPFCFLWLAAPALVYLIDKPLGKRANENIPEEDQLFLRKIGRKTWRYFDELVGPQTHWLPPDNYQTALNIEVAQRTSPTNIGLWLLSLLSAYDFKYVSCDQLIDKTLATFQELKKLERHEGHFLNWYNIQTLDPLFPRYVSTVDSGNLLASLWTLKQGMEEMISSPLIPSDPFSGIKDTFDILQETHKSRKVEGIRRLISNSLLSLPSLIAIIKESQGYILDLLSENGQSYWLKQIDEQFKEWDSIISRYFSWVTLLEHSPPEMETWKDQALCWKPSLLDLANMNLTTPLDPIIQEAQKESSPNAIKAWGKQLHEALSNARWFAGEKLGLVKEIFSEIERIDQNLNLKFLYNSDRNLFAIGYNVDARKLDSSYYDLLASEARISSLVAIAKDDAPLEHWWALGRHYNLVQGNKVLVSWGGTMFEYLMPLVFNKQYSDSLIGEGCEAAVNCQMSYGKLRGIPWGISESAYSAIDSHKIYQYKSFGVPGLGLKRQLEEDLVVSPYSSALALVVNSKAAIKNLKFLATDIHLNMMGAYGFYESIDFTRQRNPRGERGVIAYVYMAHHQGMIFTTLNNLLNNYLLVDRFHKDPRISGVHSLLYERIPIKTPTKTSENNREPILRRLEPFSPIPILGVVDTPESVTPKINLLSNEKYSLMITNTGTGYSRWGDIELYRWRADTTQDPWGSFYYIKDLQSHQVWSAAYQPTQVYSQEYTVNFKAEKAEFQRKDNGIETLTEVVVSPEDNAEIRLITLINHSNETRYIELTSYLELSLSTHQADRSHPCFNKLFIETEAFPEDQALLGFRRLRSPEDSPIWAAHILATNCACEGELQYETDRNCFIGRGNSVKNPVALQGDLSNTSGTVLDPIFSLRRRVSIESGRRIQFSFITAITDNRASALAFIQKYKDLAASHRAIELAWNFSQLELRHLRIHQEEVQLFQKLASRLIYPHIQLRSMEDRLKKNRLGQSTLWAQGISGDLPIVVVSVGDLYDMDIVKQILVAHAFWTLRGLKVDLVILNEEETSYEQPLQEHLKNQIHAHSSQMDKSGGVYLRNTNFIPPDELNLLFSVAHAILIGSRGSLRQQLVSPKSRIKYPPKLEINNRIPEESSKPLPFLELPYFNGLGGYTEDGKSYVIYLGPNTNTPAPWINVIANPQFGVLVSESGLGSTWYGNSQTNRLTPWSNDPLLNPIGDVIYIRDDETGTFWTPTPSPIREIDAYRASHSHGYSKFEHHSHGIEQELTIFVPMNDIGGLPLRIQKLRLTNNSPRLRKITLMSYSELILGDDKENTQMHLITEWDSESRALFAYNRYNPDYGDHVAFIYSNSPIASYSGDRTEFLGRNRSTSSPESLTRKSLSGHTGGALDPCGALQVSFDIKSGEIIETVFILGYAQNEESARQLISQTRNTQAIDQLLEETRSWWNKTLSTIQIDVPDKATNFLMNGWLLYQNLSCRFWGRTAFYQSSGAFGFRDQLQDSMSLIYSAPNLAREHILRSASRQFVQGDVQHWWHPQSGAGVRTRCSDDLLWLPFVTAHYIRITGDAAILQEKVSFLEGELLTEEQQEISQVPKVSQETASLLEHCRRAVIKGTTEGPHCLPLIGNGDWNDGMNLVGVHGKGESVWLAWFLIHVYNDFADLLQFSKEDHESVLMYRDKAKRLAEIIDSTSWDGAWYRRAYFDDGTPLGSKENSEDVIDSLPQSWAIITGLGNPERATTALHSANKHLVDTKHNLVLLLTPPFDKMPENPGYIKGYPPGVRENGGQYTHAAPWLAMAFARIGDGNKAVELLRMISPTLHTSTEKDNALYKIEPYVFAGDIYDLKGQEGRGGWSWYTGSAGWAYRVWLEEVLGFKLRGNRLTFDCSIPKEWDSCKIKYRYKNSLYDITINNPNHKCCGIPSIVLNGLALESSELLLVDDGHHVVQITI